MWCCRVYSYRSFRKAWNKPQLKKHIRNSHSQMLRGLLISNNYLQFLGLKYSSVRESVIMSFLLPPRSSQPRKSYLGGLCCKLFALDLSRSHLTAPGFTGELLRVSLSPSLVHKTQHLRAGWRSLLRNTAGRRRLASSPTPSRPDF